MLYNKSALHILAPPTAYYRRRGGNTMKQGGALRTACKR
jgi:hypothetical protein